MRNKNGETARPCDFPSKRERACCPHSQAASSFHDIQKIPEQSAARPVPAPYKSQFEVSQQHFRNAGGFGVVVALAGVQPALSRSMQRLETALQVSLWDGVYQLIILPHPVEEAGITCAKYGEEHLFFSLPPAHPLSGSKALYMKALNGETMLLRNRLGFWREMAVRKMPDTRFLEQEDVAFNELVQFSALPSFTTDVALRREGSPKNRINIPILDEEANVTYYCLCRPAAGTDLRSFFRGIGGDSDASSNGK